MALVDAKRAAQGTPLEMETTLACSAGLAAEYHDYIVRTAQKMRDLKPSSKLWWKKAKDVMKHEAQVSSIPALKTTDGVWVLNAQGKANLFADTCAGKCKLHGQEKQCRDTLANPSDDSSTGPDLVPARILISCAEQLAKPPQFLLLRLLETASWPESWREHWIVPIYKEKAGFFSQ